MTPLETKIQNLVSNWAKNQSFNFYDFALDALMDEILKIVNEESKEEQIKELVDELYKREYDYKIEIIPIHFVINKLEKIINGTNTELPKLRECTDCGTKFGGNERCPECNPMG